MTKNNNYSEDALVEQPAIHLLEEIGWETGNCYNETFSPDGGSEGRVTPSEVILTKRLRPALERFNPSLPDKALTLAIGELIWDRSKMSPVTANREIYSLFKTG